MTFSYMHFGLKIRGKSNKTKKNLIHRRGKSTNQKLLEIVQVTVPIFFIMIKSEK